MKRLRYASEVAEPVIGKPAATIRRRCKKIQGILGDQHDYLALRIVLRELGSQTQLNGNNGFTFGVIHGALGQRALRAEHMFDRRWQRLANGKARRWIGS